MKAEKKQPPSSRKRLRELEAMRAPGKCGGASLVLKEDGPTLERIEIASDIPCNLEWMLDDDGVTLLVRVARPK